MNVHKFDPKETTAVAEVCGKLDIPFVVIDGGLGIDRAYIPGIRRALGRRLRRTAPPDYITRNGILDKPKKVVKKVVAKKKVEDAHCD